MNSLLQSITTAGQSVHEDMFGARLQIFGVEIPCAVGGLLKDFVLVEGGKSIRNMADSLTFRKRALEEAQAGGPPPNSAVPSKGAVISLLPANATAWLPLKLDAGGLDASGEIFQFVAFDRDYMA